MGNGESSPSLQAQLEDIKQIDEVSFTINGNKYTVHPDDINITPTTSLNVFIRDHAKIKGTKVMCKEGGCGVCIVSVRSIDPVTARENYYSVNSCLVSVLSCQGWDITTIEGIGSQKNGLHVIQDRLADFSGTQCGFCTPGWIMNMYSLYQKYEPGSLTMKEVENSFAGNICRCTGYRPIADAFKSLTGDADQKLLDMCRDIEDLKVCPKTQKECTGNCRDTEFGILNEIPYVALDFKNAKWVKVKTVADIYNLFELNSNDKYMLVAGNTGNGVYRRDPDIKLYIDISTVAELQEHDIGDVVSVGGNTTLTSLMRLLRQIAIENKKFAYFNEMYDHIDLVAHIPVRNIGTIAGNLMLKYMNNEFQSDIFLLLETFGAQLVIGKKDTPDIIVSPAEFLNLDMTHRVILKIILKPLDNSTHIYRTYKIMPRAQNAHAHVNAGFVMNVSSDNVVQKATIVYGGINPNFIHASSTEAHLVGKHIFNDEVLQTVYQSLRQEVVPNVSPPEPSPAFRQGLAIALFYKFVLSVAPKTNLLNNRYASGGPKLEKERPVSSGTQTYDSDVKKWPLQKPIPKLEAYVQCTGEASYVVDASETLGRDLYATFVLADTVPKSVIKNIDTSKALAQPGVIAFIGKDDIPGVNSFTPPTTSLAVNEVIFCEGTVLYNGQPIGLIVATSKDLADQAAKLVQVEYTVSTRKPLLTSRQVLASKETDRVRDERTVNPTARGNNVTKVIKGTMDIYEQYHYSMETQACVCVPTEDSLDVYSSTQWMDLNQKAIAASCKIPEHKINMFVRRLGGAYGAKISRATHVAAACAVAATVLNKPIHLHMSFENNMDAIGKRFPCASDYEIGVDNAGKIQYLKNSFYQDYGVYNNERIGPSTATTFTNCYDTTTWEIKAHGVFTDKPPNTFARAPSTTEGIAMSEYMMEHIAQTLQLDATAVRLANMTSTNNPLPTLITNFKKTSNYDKRKLAVDDFNAKNRWRKKGIALVPMQYRFEVYGNFNVLVSVFSGDGTVAVQHGGIEMGQGINTKVAQVCAYSLGIDLKLVVVKPSNNMVAPNNMVTGGSIGSEACCLATIRCCEELLRKLAPVRKTLNNPDWKTLISAARRANVDLSSKYMYTPQDEQSYNIWGVSIAEVEVDILTGLAEISRVDILEDTGESMSPIVDIGQVEGAFIMGIGYWLSEDIVFNENTGKLLTNRTWYYKPPGIKDIPTDMRVKFRQKSPNAAGVLRSKATGEPALCMAVVVAFAVRNALASARLESGGNAWYDLDGPITTEERFLRALNNPTQYKLQ